MNTQKIKFQLETAENHFKNNNLSAAELILNNLLTLSPNNSKALELLAYVKSEQGHHGSAHELLIKSCNSNECTAEALYYLGKSYLNRNQFSNSIESLNKSLKINGGFFEGLHDLGLAQAQLGYKTEALESLSKAHSFNKNSVSVLFNIAKLQAEIGNVKEALIFLDRVIYLSPKLAEAWFYKGVLLSDSKAFEEALIYFDKATEINNKYAIAWLNKGIVLKYLKSFELAKISYEKALLLAPDNPKILNEFGLYFLESNNHTQAIIYFDKVLLSDPNNIESLINKAATLSELNLHEQSILLYRKALEIEPLSTISWSNMGVVENNIGNHEKALNCFETAINLKPDYAEAWSNKGVMFMDINDYEQAVICFNTAISFESANPNYHHNLSHAYFNLKNFENAWPEYDWRWQLQYMNSEKLSSNKPIWDGVKSNSTLFIWGEQGIGDQILFSSMLHELRLSFDKIIVSIDKKLLPIFKRSFPGFVFIDRKSSLDETNYDFQIPLGSIPKFLRTSINDFNLHIHPYLTVNQDITNTRINELKNNDHLICGVSWRSFNTQIGDKKSIPFKKLEPIIEIQGIDFLNLQYYPDNFMFSKTDSVIHKNLISIDNIDLYNDLENLAYLIQTCDVLVTCSNSTAHLAGALNKTTFLLAPFSSGKFWYWNEHDGKSLWYPSIKVFYQAKDGSWDKAIESIVCHLESLK